MPKIEFLLFLAKADQTVKKMKKLKNDALKNLRSYSNLMEDDLSL